MSRIGKQLIPIPEKTEVTFVNGLFTVKGPKGELAREFKPIIDVKIDGSTISLVPVSKTLESNALWGTYAAHVVNMITGVNTLFAKKLVLEGIGFKADVAGTTLKMALGFSHPVNVEIPKGLTITIEKGVLTISGADKDLVGQFSAKLRDMKKPEPYKGKGFHYDTETVKRKQGKKAA